MVHLPTAYFHQWALEPDLPMGKAGDSPLRHVTMGGEALKPEAVGAWRRTWGSTIALHNHYGPTETVVTPTSYLVPETNSETKMPPRIPIGRPLPNRTAYVVDTLGKLVPRGVAGELLLGGVPLARGYLRRPVLTAEKFVPHPFGSEPGARLYRTGDLVRYLPDGTLDFLGRVDRQVKVAGYRIELGEIELALSEQAGVTQGGGDGEGRCSGPISSGWLLPGP